MPAGGMFCGTSSKLGLRLARMSKGGTLFASTISMLGRRLAMMSRDGTLCAKIAAAPGGEGG
eukprot:424180-Rhodomonas_salina.1